MNEKVSVNKAMLIGHLVVNLPCGIVLFGPPGICFYFYQRGIIPLLLLLLSIVIAFCLAWGVWSLMITKWRIWAFSNVRNVRELKKRAIDERLIWPDYSVFEKTEIRSKSEQKTIQKLEEKLNRKMNILWIILYPINLKLDIQN